MCTCHFIAAWVITAAAMPATCARARLQVTVDAENGSISVWNDGKGIPIQMHKEHHVYVPELIFGNLLTGSNFDDDQKKTTGGRNGFGAKVTPAGLAAVGFYYGRD